MSQLILHIPHSATNIPLTDGFVQNDSLLNNEILKLTDWHTDDLLPAGLNIRIVAVFRSKTREVNSISHTYRIKNHFKIV